MKTRYLILSALFITSLTISGAAYAHDGGGKDGHDGWSLHGDCHKAHLPEAKRQLLHETMKAAFEKNKGLFDQMHKLHEKMHDVLKAETFNPQAFTAVSAQIEKLHDRVHKIRTDAFASIATQFTPEEREMVARHLGHHHHGHDGERHHHDGADRDHSMNDGASSAPQDQAYPPYPAR
jgi:Spy/CpxP family protein refolding chaperone